MRSLHLVLIAPLWLALSGAAPAPAPSALDAMAECREPRERLDGLLAPLAVRSSRPANEGTGIITYYEIPADLRAFGYAPHMLARNVGGKDEVVMQLLTAVKGPFDEVEARMLAGHGLQTCPVRIPGGTRNCALKVETRGGGSAMLVLQDFGDNNIGINCAYLAEQD
jgi:hypothetical protein